MGKKKPAKVNQADLHKEAGNKAFVKKEYSQAVKEYSMAIELSKEKPNHIYFANRANAHLEMWLFEQCITDCNNAIEVDPTFPKSYYRKAKAQIGLQKYTDALETLKTGLEKSPDYEDFRPLMASTEEKVNK